MWARVFGAVADEVAPSKLLEYLHGIGLPVEGHFRGDDLGWTACEIILPGVKDSPVVIERYLTEHDDLRGDLNSWAAGLEATAEYAPNSIPLMQRIVTTQQLMTIRRPIDHGDEVTLDRLIDGLCQFLAAESFGVYQIDGRGFFDSDGTLLVQEY